MTDRSDDKADERQMDRRGLLRTGGAAVVAGVAGYAVAEVASAGPASATGADLVVDTTNTGSATTTLTSSTTAGSSLLVGNTGGAAPLGLVDVPFPDDVSPLEIGDVASFDGDLYYTADLTGQGDAFTSYLFTWANANQIIPISPQRVVDTRNPAGRTRIVNPSVLRSSGMLAGGQTMQVRLDDYEFGSLAAMCNLAVVRPSASGWAVLYPGGPLPPTSSLNFMVGITLANFAITGIQSGEPTDGPDTVSIHANVDTHILLDIVAFSGDMFSVNSEILLPSVATTSAATRRARAARNAPSWYRGSR